MAEEVVSIFAGVNGFLDHVDLTQVASYESALQDYMKIQGAEVLDTIAKTGDLTDETKQALNTLVDTFTKQFLESKTHGVA